MSRKKKLSFDSNFEGNGLGDCGLRIADCGLRLHAFLTARYEALKSKICILQSKIPQL